MTPSPPRDQRRRAHEDRALTAGHAAVLTSVVALFAEGGLRAGLWATAGGLVVGGGVQRLLARRAARAEKPREP